MNFAFFSDFSAFSAFPGWKSSVWEPGPPGSFPAWKSRKSRKIRKKCEIHCKTQWISHFLRIFRLFRLFRAGKLSGGPGSQTEDVHPWLPDRGCLDVEHCDVELKAHNLACSNCLASSTYDSIFMTYDLGFMTYELSSAIYGSWPMIDDLLSRTYDLWCIIDGLRPIIYYLSSMGYYWLFTTYFL